MLITENVYVTINSSNKKHYIELGYNIKNKQIINIPTKHLTIGSHVKIKAKCDICGVEKELMYSEYLKNIKYYNIFACCRKCANIKRELTNEKKYGVKYVSQLDEVKEKMKNTMLEKYGVEHALQNKELLNKSKETNLEKYGTEHPQQLLEIKEKTKKTNIEKYGKECHTQTDEYIEKTKKTNLEKYETEWYMSSEDFKQKSDKTKLEKYGTIYPQELEEQKIKNKNTNLEKYGKESFTQTIEYLEKTKKTNFEKYGIENISHLKSVREKSLKTRNKNRLIELKEDNIISIDYSNDLYCFKCDCGEDHNFTISSNNYKNRKTYNIKLCTICNDYSKYSGKEKELLQFISENYKYEISLNSRNIISPYELDIYLPELKLAFEFNGLYWHNELNKPNNYHKMKSDMCDEKGIQLIYVWEDDWFYKQPIIKSMILNKLGKTQNKVYARKCEIKEINDNKLIKEFLEVNHIQGFVGSFFRIGLYNSNELVSIMTFGKKRKFMNSINKNGEWELLRFCNKLNTNVIGGASKLFKYFINVYNPIEIVTYADRSYSNGKLYEILGFEFQHKTEPNYYYIIGNLKKHRFNFRKDALIKEGYDKNKTEHEIMLERKISRIFNAGNLKYAKKIIWEVN